jgi:hypothetical protein
MFSDFHLFRSFLPFRNPIGFGASDFIELALAVLLVSTIALRAYLEPFARKLAERTGTCMLVLAALSVALRLLLLPHCPVPTPSGSDDFSYILLGDTLAHFRLSNPTHPFHQFFEAVFILQRPTYSSIYPLGQGIVLAFGRLVFGHFWAGVLLSEAAFCSLCYWMLRAWTTPLWALIGGLLAVMEFGPLSQWMNTYWGGGVSGIAGCLVFGSLPRLHQTQAMRYASLLGVGLALQLLSRPFEFVLLAVAVLLFWVRWRPAAKTALIVLIVLLPAVGLTLLQNESVTGSWATLPYMLSRYEYGVPAAFTFQPNPAPHRPLTPEQELDYRAQAAIHGNGTETIKSYLGRLACRARYVRFFLFAPLCLLSPVSLSAVREFRVAWVFLTLALFALGTNFYPYFYPHYVAAIACLFLLTCIMGLAWLSRIRMGMWPAGKSAAQLILSLCVAHFLFFYAVYLSGNDEIWPIATYDHWDFINYGDPDGRIAVNRQLTRAPGKQLVFVRYWPQHRFQEWIHNGAGIDAGRIVWALDLGPEKNQQLIRYYYPERKVWVLEPDAHPPKLTPYEAESGTMLTVH